MFFFGCSNFLVELWNCFTWRSNKVTEERKKIGKKNYLENLNREEREWKGKREFVWELSLEYHDFYRKCFAFWKEFNLLSNCCCCCCRSCLFIFIKAFLLNFLSSFYLALSSFCHFGYISVLEYCNTLF